MGQEAAGAQALRLVAERGHDVVGVLTGAEADGRASPLADIAGSLATTMLDPARVTDPGFADWIADHRVDLLLNVHSLRIASAAVLAAPRVGSFNLHPGPLPRYAGLNAPSWAIYEGQSRHAVTLHWMAAEVDEGPIAYEAWFDIGPDDTGLRVAANCARHGLPLVARLLDDATRGGGAVPAVAQPPGERRWYGRAAPHGGRLPWSLPARRVVDLVRAATYAPFTSPWGWPRSTIDDREVEIVRVAATARMTEAPPGTVGEVADGGVRVATADEWVLVVRLRADGRPQPPEEVLPAGRRFAVDPPMT